MHLRHPEEQVTLTWASWKNPHTWPIFCPLKEATLFFLPKRAHKKVLSIIGTNLQHSLHNTSLAMVTKWKIRVSPLPKKQVSGTCDGYEFLIVQLTTETHLQGMPQKKFFLVITIVLSLLWTLYRFFSLTSTATACTLTGVTWNYFNT